jgi:nicotinamide-nucleotide amidase
VHRTEAEIEEIIGDLLRAQTNPTIALYARPGYVAIRVTAKGTDEKDADRLIESVASEIEKRMTVSRYNIEADVVKDLHEMLLAKGLTVSAAESCTGGLIGKLLTDTPGSSEYFKGSAVTYWNEAKEKVLSVHKDTLDEYTAVSEPVARQMAEGSRALYSSDIAVSTTGYAGPGKGERGEDAGLVYIGVSGPLGSEVHEEHFYGSRRSVRYGAAEKALYYVLKYAERLRPDK